MPMRGTAAEKFFKMVRGPVSEAMEVSLATGHVNQVSQLSHKD